MYKNGVLYFSVFFLLFCLFCFLSLQGGQVLASEYIWVFSRILLAFWVLRKLFIRNIYSYSLEKIFYIFVFMFFLVAPISQYFDNVVLWNANLNDHTLESYLFADFLLAIFLFCFNIGIKKVKKNKKDFIFRDLSYNTSPFLMLILTVFHAYIFYWFIANIGFPEMLFRSTNVYISDTNSTAIGLIISKYFKSISIVIVFLLIGNLKSKFLFRNILITINLFFLFMLYFPTSAARFQIIAVYLGFFLFFKRDKISNHSITNLLVVGLFLVLPFLEVTRHISTFNEISIEKINNAISIGYSDGNFDSYQMFVNCISYVKDNGTTFGSQLLVVALFFVPRSIWPTKPVGSGFEVAEVNSLSFNNVSMPIIGEGYINFGVIGVILFGFFLGYFCRRFDNTYWSNPLINNTFNHFYVIFLGYFFFMNRGDLLSSFAFTIALYFAFFSINKLLYIFRK